MPRLTQAIVLALSLGIFYLAMVPVQHLQAAQTQSAQTSFPASVPLPDGAGMETTKRICSKCHSTDIFARQRHDIDHWNEIIDNMTSKGMKASDDDLDDIADYLSTNLGEKSPAPALPAQKM